MEFNVYRTNLKADMTSDFYYDVLYNYDMHIAVSHSTATLNMCFERERILSNDFIV